MITAPDLEWGLVATTHPGLYRNRGDLGEEGGMERGICTLSESMPLVFWAAASIWRVEGSTQVLREGWEEEEEEGEKEAKDGGAGTKGTILLALL